ncbi:ATP-binding protein [Streptomyces sp. NBC_01294]|uniref:ATP-binding protein n=1 Tax=Streptomyces sp. NBC_01294 TaxID=2903815 RepID=UPI002DDAD9E2|nr:AAA family ATPase [Streptomyces sp. NBC_01294]WRZ60567.1 LuxR C-terminal-related transcriptional regulator [Streptomyces sp. NBC_01294]
MDELAVIAQDSLRGRTDHMVALEEALAVARSGESTVLVLRGEAGVGKTSLLHYVEGQATGFRTLGISGIESEMAMPYASLQQLCAPMLGRLYDLPGPQREALSVAFGLLVGKTVNRFLVGLAVGSLLAAAAEDHPLVCLIDDAQWLDETSIEVLTFVARRLSGKPVALIFASQKSEGEQMAGLPQLIVDGLSEPDARALLVSAVGVPLDPAVRDRMVSEAHGNPTALLHLPHTLTAGDLAGGFWLPSSPSMASYLENIFYQQFVTLPGHSQLLLQTAAAEPTGDVGLLFRAARLQGVAVAAAGMSAEASGLVEFGSRVRFRHLLVRSVIYSRLSTPTRRSVHQALAEATERRLDPDRRAWHRAHAATQPDEEVASELEVSAGRAQHRGGIAAKASFLRRSAELTPSAERRVTRSLVAAQVEIDAGEIDRAEDMLATAEAGPLDDFQMAWLERLRARMVFAKGRGSDAPQMLLESASRLALLDAASARDTLLEAVGAAIFAGRLNEGQVPGQVAAAARSGPPQPVPRTVDVLLNGVASLTLDGYPACANSLKEALKSVRQEEAVAVLEGEPYPRLACSLLPESLAVELWDDEAWEDLAANAVVRARTAGALAILPIALNDQACFHVHAGAFDKAAGEIAEAAAISAVTGSPAVIHTALVLGGWKAAQPEALELVETSIKDAGTRGEGRAIGLAEYATALRYNGLGRYDAALAAARSACQYEDLGSYGWALVELIEAACRSGQQDAAATGLAKLAERTRASGTAWARGTEACSRALLSDGRTAEAFYLEAIEALATCRIALQLARARLLYGEWLRRENRRQESRAYLRSAYEAFSRAGADCFAERARRELSVTGDTARKRTVGTDLELTSQEAQIARLAEQGLTNGEIAAQLFISPRTVEWHLGNVFAKLGVSSRRHLHAAMPPHEVG